MNTALSKCQIFYTEIFETVSIQQYLLLINIWDPGDSHKQHSYICSNSQKYIVWVKIIIFLLCQKSLDIKIMFHEDILYRKYIKT